MPDRWMVQVGRCGELPEVKLLFIDIFVLDGASEHLLARGHIRVVQKVQDERSYFLGRKLGVHQIDDTVERPGAEIAVFQRAPQKYQRNTTELSPASHRQVRPGQNELLALQRCAGVVHGSLVPPRFEKAFDSGYSSRE